MTKKTYSLKVMEPKRNHDVIFVKRDARWDTYTFAYRDIIGQPITTEIHEDSLQLLDDDLLIAGNAVNTRACRSGSGVDKLLQRAGL